MRKSEVGLKPKGDLFAGIVYWLINVGTVIGSVFMVVLMLLIVTNIIMRFFKSPILGHYELVELFALVAVSFALVYAAMHKTHVAIEVLVSRFPQRVQAALEVFTSLFGLGFWAIIFWASAGIIPERVMKGETSHTLEIPYLPFRLFWVSALLLFCLVLIIDIVKAWQKAVKK
ncbi:TRAP transporter small permease [Thermodesulfobacteriota bacterium]